MQAPLIKNMIAGIQQPGLYVIGSRPGVGKTAVALEMTKRYLDESKGVLYFSFDMDAGQLMTRLNLAQGNTCGDFLLIHDNPALSAENISAFIRETYRERNGDIKCVIIDYCELVHTSNRRADELATLFMELKLLAKIEMVSVIVLAQLKRGIPTHQHPMVDDLVCQPLRRQADAYYLLYENAGVLSWTVQKRS